VRRSNSDRETVQATSPRPCRSRRISASSSVVRRCLASSACFHSRPLCPGSRSASLAAACSRKAAAQGCREVLAPQEAVAGRGADLQNAVVDLDHRDVEGPSAQVEHEERGLVPRLVKPVGHRGSGGLVDQPLDLQAGQLSGRPSRPALRVREVGGHADHRLVDPLAEGRLGILLQERRTKEDSSSGRNPREPSCVTLFVP